MTEIINHERAANEAQIHWVGNAIEASEMNSDEMREAFLGTFRNDFDNEEEARSHFYMIVSALID